MLHQYFIKDNNHNLNSKLISLKDSYPSWGKYKFSDLAGLYGAFSEEMGEKDFKKILIGQFASSFLMPANSDLEQSFHTAIRAIGLEAEYSESFIEIFEAKDSGVTHVLLYLPSSNIYLDDEMAKKNISNNIILPVNKIFKSKTTEIELHSDYEDFDYSKLSENTRDFLDNKSKRLFTIEAFKLIKTIIPNAICGSIWLQNRNVVEEWCALILDEHIKNISINFPNKNNKGYSIFDIKVSEFKQMKSHFVDETLLVLTVEDFNYLCKEKLFPKSLKRWVDQFGTWGLRYF